jgi:hypothetical protein
MHRPGRRPAPIRPLIADLAPPPYAPPSITYLGTLRELTQGGDTGFGDGVSGVTGSGGSGSL